MANIFSDYPHRSIPTSISQCMQESPTASHIRQCAAWIESIGQMLVTITAIIGSILTMTLFIMAIPESFSGALLILVILAITFITICFAIYIGYHIPALIAGALSSIVQSTMISANVALFSSQPEHDQVQSAEHTSPTPTPVPPILKSSSFLKTDSWVCTSCGASNNHLSQSCTNCGNYR